MTDSLSRLWELVTQSAGDWTTSGLLLKAALVACSLFATVQLLTMLSTQYGDQNASSKSFFLSLVLHCCFGLGWATVVQTYPPPSSPPGEPDQPRVRVTLATDFDASPETGASNKPVWTKTPERPDQLMTRIERPDQSHETIDKPELEKPPTETVVPPDAPDLPSRTDEPVAPPTQQAQMDVTARSVARPPTAIDQPTVEARPETTATTSMSRQSIQREVASTEAPARMEPARGASERTAPLIEDGSVLTLPTEVTPEATLPKPVGVPSDQMQRRASPSPIPADLAETGSNPTQTPAVNTTDRKSGRFSRSGNRSSSDPDFDPQAPAARASSSPSTTTEQPTIASRGTIGGDFPGNTPQPQFVRPNTPAMSSRQPTRTTEPYRARRIEQRRGIALKNGGSEASERAVEASLRWMADVQEADGRWSSARYGGGAAKRDPQGQDRLDGGLYADSGITGLVVLSFLGAGYTHEEGQYSSTVKRGLDWLIKQQQSNGYLGGKATRYDMMYCHAIATFAIAEAYGMQSDPNAFPELRKSVHDAIRLICAMQNEDGGWRYGKGGESDMSMFGWQLMALKSAVNAGISVPEETRRGMTKFLQARALGVRGGLAGYKANERPTPAMTAEALFCRQMFNVRQDDAASQEAVTYLGQNLPRLALYDEYYWYYGTLAMFQYNGEPWEDWNSSLRDTLIGLQRTQGPLAGSWDPKGKWAGIGGRLYSTAISTMCLEVYYRFLRIYQFDE